MWRQMLLVEEDAVDVPAGPNSRVCMLNTSEWARMWW